MLPNVLLAGQLVGAFQRNLSTVTSSTEFPACSERVKPNGVFNDRGLNDFALPHERALQASHTQWGRTCVWDWIHSQESASTLVVDANLDHCRIPGRDPVYCTHCAAGYFRLFAFGANDEHACAKCRPRATEMASAALQPGGMAVLVFLLAAYSNRMALQSKHLDLCLIRMLINHMIYSTTLTRVTFTTAKQVPQVWSVLGKLIIIPGRILRFDSLHFECLFKREPEQRLLAQLPMAMLPLLLMTFCTLVMLVLCIVPQIYPSPVPSRIRSLMNDFNMARQYDLAARATRVQGAYKILGLLTPENGPIRKKAKAFFNDLVFCHICE